MCIQLSARAASLCDQYRSGLITLAKLGQYLQIHKITQEEYDQIVNEPDCPCGWIEPAALATEPSAEVV